MVSLALFAGSLVLSGLALTVLRRSGVLDIPNERSLHDRPTVRGGGTGPAVAGLAGLAMLAPRFGGLAPGLAFAAGGLALLGLVDDVRGMPVLPRFVAQAGVALTAVVALIGPGWSPAAWLLTGFAALWLISYLNAFNFMDGINGISVVQVVVAGAVWAVAGRSVSLPGLELAGLAGLALALGFAPFNLPRAQMFLGDAGSYFFGGWLGATAVWAVARGVPPEAVLAPLTLYLADTGATLAGRIRRGESWLQPHKTHVYQKLVALGWPHIRVALFCGAVMALCGGLGLLSLSSPPPARLLAGAGIIVVLAAYLNAPRLIRTPQVAPANR